jgi:hypothetical protein
MNKHKGQTVVVCGHKTTVPDMLNILTGSEKYQTLTDNQDIFIVTVKEIGSSKVLNLNQFISGK